MASHAELSGMRYALLELQELLEGPRHERTALQASASTCVEAAHALHARECEVQTRADQALLDLQTLKRKYADLTWEVRGRSPCRV